MKTSFFNVEVENLMDLDSLVSATLVDFFIICTDPMYIGEMVDHYHDYVATLHSDIYSEAETYLAAEHISRLYMDWATN